MDNIQNLIQVQLVVYSVIYYMHSYKVRFNISIYTISTFAQCIIQQLFCYYCHIAEGMSVGCPANTS